MVPMPHRKRRGLVCRTILSSQSQLGSGSGRVSETRQIRTSVAVCGLGPTRILPPTEIRLPSEHAEVVTAPAKVYATNPLDVVLGRYQVQSPLGSGSFGTVVSAQDKYTGTVVAIKMLHKDEDLNCDAQKEVRLYNKLLSGCDRHTGLFAAVIGTGVHLGHHCIVFEMCQGTLYEVIHGLRNLKPLPARHVLEMAYQLIKGIEYLHSVGIVHADIKPDNIALRSIQTTSVSWLHPFTGFCNKEVLVSPEICILDLGMAVDMKEQFSGLGGRIGNRAYRAPEVSLGLPWSFGVDAFAVGCVVSELYLCSDLFPSDVSCDLEHLALVQKIVGPFPEQYAQQVERQRPGTFSLNPATVLFPPRGILDSAIQYSDAMIRVERSPPLSASIHDINLHDLLRSLMQPDPSVRVELRVAAKHRYFDRLSRLELQ